MVTLLDLFLLGIQQLSKKYSEIKFALEKISYYEHNWIICVDLKMVGFPLGLQCGCTKFPCFL